MRILFKDIKPVSTNDMYIPTKGKSKGAFLRRSNELNQFKDEIHTRLRESLMIDKFVKSDAYNISIIVSMPEFQYYIKNRSRLRANNDASNFIKSIEDAVSEYFQYNDSINLTVSCEKCYNKRDVWDFSVDITPSEVSDNYKDLTDYTNYDYISNNKEVD